MKRVLWIILGIAFASFLYAGNKQQQKAQRVQPTPTPTPNVQKGRGLGIAAHKEIAPTPSTHEPAQGGPDTEKTTTVNGSKSNSFKEEGGKNDGEKNVTLSASDKTTVNTSKSNTFKEVAPTMTPNAERKNSAHASEKVASTVTPAKVPVKK
jgi:hypothetical protein